MKRSSWPIILLLVFALLLQNTCLHGFAGKTSFTSFTDQCTQCPSKTGKVKSPDVAKVLSSDSITIYFPMYIFTMPVMHYSVQLQRHRNPEPALVNGYKDAVPDELLKPPRAWTAA